MLCRENRFVGKCNQGIENCDDYVVCIDSSNGKVVSWSKYDKDSVIAVANDFYEYFMDRVENAIANF